MFSSTATSWTQPHSQDDFKVLEARYRWQHKEYKNLSVVSKLFRRSAVRRISEHHAKWDGIQRRRTNESLSNHRSKQQRLDQLWWNESDAFASILSQILNFFAKRLEPWKTYFRTVKNWVITKYEKFSRQLMSTKTIKSTTLRCVQYVDGILECNQFFQFIKLVRDTANKTRQVALKKYERRQNQTPSSSVTSSRKSSTASSKNPSPHPQAGPSISRNS